MASWIWQESYCIIACELLELTQYLEYSRILYNVYAFCNRKVHIVIYILYHDMPPCNVRDASHYVRSTRTRAHHIVCAFYFLYFLYSIWITCAHACGFGELKALGCCGETNSLQRLYSRQRCASASAQLWNMGRVPCHMRWESLWTLIQSLRLAYLFKRGIAKSKVIS